VNDHTDGQLLQIYVGSRSEPAFATLVQRHLDFVYSAAVRMVRDPHLAQDVTQGVFVALAQNARQLMERPVLSGWLHRTTQNIAAQAIRTDVRRRAREQEAAVMKELLTAEPDATWEQISPHLDNALSALAEADRDALLLRYFDRKSAQEMAGLLGITSEAAQKRVNRAVDRLRELFSKQKITIGAGGLMALISANAVQSAPVGLATTISATAILAGASASTILTAIQTTAMTTLQKTLVALALATTAGAGIFEAHQAAQWRGQNQSLTQQVAQLQTDSESLSNRLANANDSAASQLTDAQFNELLKLRGEVGVLRRQAGEMEQLQAQNQQLRARALIGQTQTNQVSPHDQFMLDQWHITDAMKQIGLAMRLYGADHNNQYPTNFDQIKDELVVTNFAGNIGLDAFEFMNAGLVNESMPQMIVLRQRIARQFSESEAWVREYGLADGSVQTIYEDKSESFADYEKQHSPPQGQ
jgi:RNA polymerase sigma factor (sigma-70 family)